MTEFTLTGDDTYAGIVFSPNVKGVEQVEATLPYTDPDWESGDERTFTQDDHDAAMEYAHLISAAPKLLDACQHAWHNLIVAMMEHPNRMELLEDAADVLAEAIKATGQGVGEG